MSTATETGAAEVVQSAYAAINAGDVDAFINVLAEDCVLEEAAGHPYGGKWTGHEDIKAAFGGLAASIGLRGVTVHDIVANETTAVGLIEIAITSSTGEESTMSVAEVWEVRDGKAVSIRPHYWDTVELQKLGN